MAGSVETLNLCRPCLAHWISGPYVVSAKVEALDPETVHRWAEQGYAS